VQLGIRELLRDYQDILSRLGEPLWYDSGGVPRYEPFAPELCNVYAAVVALNEIRCQFCQKMFKVSVEFSSSDWPGNLPEAPEAIGDLLHYGDPPYHSCRPGDSMNSIPQRILEYWQRSHETNLRWVQVQSLAGMDIMPQWAREKIDSGKDITDDLLP
jgi:hypothetical protein